MDLRMGLVKLRMIKHALQDYILKKRLHEPPRMPLAQN